MPDDATTNDDSHKQLNDAFNECRAKMLEGAHPFEFADDARRYLRDKCRESFQGQMKEGTWEIEHVKARVLAAALSIGTVAKSLHVLTTDAPDREIESRTVDLAFKAVQAQCTLLTRVGRYCS
jgi:hypothetical protein